MINRDGPAGTLAALRATLPVGAGVLIGPDGGQVEGLQDEAGTGPGAAIDARLDDLDGRVSALESGGDAA